MLTLTDDQARLNITFMGQDGDLPDPILWTLTDLQIRQIATEAVRSGSVPGIPLDESANFTNFKVDRIKADDNNPVNRILLRPQVPFGGGED